MIFTIAVAFLCGTAAATPPAVTVVSPCECQNAQGKRRWAVKNDSATPPTDTTAIQSTTPSQVSCVALSPSSSVWPSSAIFSHYRQLYLLGSGKTEAELSGESAVSQTVA
jgi:DNA-binding transcriptional regulator YdaS (Cro superfamily)